MTIMISQTATATRKELTRLSKPLLFSAMFTLSGCSGISSGTWGSSPSDQANHIAPAANDAAECQALLERPIDYAYHQSDLSNTLDPSGIQLVNWNIQKGKQSGWQSDLRQLGSGSELVLIQEAALEPELLNLEGLASFWSFAPGYRSDAAQTGVMTFSSVEPLSHCQLTDHEPWLRTPKATSITEYRLASSTETLVVVNIHAINFTIGVKQYSQQLARIGQILVNHTGPMIVSGDFNSWRTAREKRLQQLVEKLELRALEYAVDNRVQVFGRPIDHIYVRGLDTVDSIARAVTSSDHNPMKVNLALATPEQ